MTNDKERKTTNGSKEIKKTHMVLFSKITFQFVAAPPRRL